MLGFVGIGLPIFITSALFSVPITVFWLYMAIISVNCLFFIILAKEMKNKDSVAAFLKNRHLRQSIGAGLWAVSLLVISISAAQYGTHTQLFLGIMAGASVGIMFFSSPVLAQLLILAPVSMAGPIIGLRIIKADDEWITLVSGGLILCFAISIALNRHLQDHHRLALSRSQLFSDHMRELKLSEQLSHSRTNLLHTLSEEVAQSLNMIEAGLRRGLDHLARAPLPRSEFSAVLTHCLSLKNQINDTIDTVTLAAGEVHYVPELFDLKNIIDRLSHKYHTLALTKGLSFELHHTSPKKGAVRADAGRLLQILDHLLSNAYRYTPAGRFELTITYCDQWVHFDIIDSGPGLSGEEITTAFKPYGRVERTHMGQRGLGLGLTLCQSLCELMGGKMGAESALLIGSRFWVEMPFDPSIDLAPQKDDQPKPHLKNGLKIFLIAQDALRGAEIKIWLESLGHTPLLCQKIERAEKFLKGADFDCLFVETLNMSDYAPLAQLFETLTRLSPNLKKFILLAQKDNDNPLPFPLEAHLIWPYKRDDIGLLCKQLTTVSPYEQSFIVQT